MRLSAMLRKGMYVVLYVGGCCVIVAVVNLKGEVG